IYSFFAVGAYACIQLILSFFGINDPFANQKLSFMVRPNAFAYEPSFYALFMVPMVFYFNNLYLIYKARGVGFRVLLLNIFYLASTSTGTVFAYIIYLMMSISKIQRLLPYIVLVLLLIILSYPFFSDIYDTFFFKFFRWDFYNHWSFRERWGQIVNSYFVFKDNPIFGVGLGGVGMYIFERYSQGQDYYLRASETLLTFKSFDPMNVTTEILASQGVFGVVCYLIFLLFLFGKVKYAIKRAQLNEEKAMLKSLLVATVLMLVVLQFNQGVFRTYIWVQMAVLYSASMHVLSGRRLSLW
ncbi:O-antigen ligase family protein, partial [Rhodanobacter aciditrophus]